MSNTSNRKDWWDKAQIIGNVLLPIVVVLIGWWLDRSVDTAKKAVNDSVESAQMEVNREVAAAELRLQTDIQLQSASNEAFQRAIEKNMPLMTGGKVTMEEFKSDYIDGLRNFSLDESVIDHIRNPARLRVLPGTIERPRIGGG